MVVLVDQETHLRLLHLKEKMVELVIIPLKEVVVVVELLQLVQVHQVLQLVTVELELAGPASPDSVEVGWLRFAADTRGGTPKMPVHLRADGQQLGGKSLLLLVLLHLRRHHLVETHVRAHACVVNSMLFCVSTV